MRNEMRIRPIVKLLSMGLAAGLLGGVGVAQAVPFTPNAFNTIADESREAYVDANINGVFDAGDVIVGYIKLEGISPGTNGPLTPNSLYGVFSQQVLPTSGGGVVQFGATTVAGLTLSDLVGGPVAAGSLVALFENPAGFGVNLETTDPGGASFGMKNYTDYLTNPVNGGSLLMTVGLGGGTDYVQSQTNFLGAPTSNFVGVPGSVQIAATRAGLSILDNNTGLTFAGDVATSPFINPPFLVFSQLGLSGGAVDGSGNFTPNPQTWLIASGYGAFFQCAVSDGEGGFINQPCGFQDKNDFTVHPTQVPEPGSLLLLGVALLATGGAGALRRKK